MANKKIFLAIIMLAIAMMASNCSAVNIFEFLTDFNSDWDATTARNLRSECRLRYFKANEAQNKMFEMENNDDVNGYEKWLEIMREEDRKLAECSAKYEEVRDYLESMIWKGELIIEGFERRYEKGTIASIVDHLTGRAKL